MLATAPQQSVFGGVHLGYIVIETEKFSDWSRFGRDAIGLHVDHPLRDAMRFRLDDHACRFLLRRGPTEDVTALGWQADTDELLDEIVRRVRGNGVPVHDAHPDDAELRGVGRLVRFPGPNGLTQEVFTGAQHGSTPLLAAVRGGFVTGEGGMGHVAVTSKRPHQMRGYYANVFDARLSDFIDETISGIKVKIRFLRVNQRHHSIAIAAVNRLPINPIRTRVQHLNIQVADLEDLTGAYERVRELGFAVTMDVGQHTNDKELSFYAETPSGFEWETGWNPIIVDESDWEPTTYQGISIWGHRAGAPSMAGKLEQIHTAVRSVLQREQTVPALAGRGIADSCYHNDPHSLSRSRFQVVRNG